MSDNSSMPTDARPDAWAGRDTLVVGGLGWALCMTWVYVHGYLFAVNERSETVALLTSAVPWALFMAAITVAVYGSPIWLCAAIIWILGRKPMSPRDMFLGLAPAIPLLAAGALYLWLMSLD